jgi:hypothetical protein
MGESGEMVNMRNNNIYGAILTSILLGVETLLEKNGLIALLGLQ